MKNILLINILILCTFPILAQTYGLDSMFGVNGLRTLKSGTGSSGIRDIEVHSDKKVFAAGDINNLTKDVLIIKNLANGKPDNSFGNKGRAIIDLGGEETINDMALQSDGKVIACGLKTQKGKVDKFLLMRLDQNGVLDNTFGVQGSVEFSSVNGISTTEVNFRNVRIQSDGKILVIGRALFSKSEYKGLAQRYKTNGTLDSTFGKNGSVEIKFTNGIYNYGESIHVIQNGKILVLGSFYTTTYVHGLMRLNNNGKIDSTFGVNGVKSSTFAGLSYFIPYWINEMQNGDIVTVGYLYTGTKYKVFATKHLSNGQIKTTFGNNGIATYDASIGANYAYDAYMHANGEISIPAEAYTNNTSVACVFRLDSLGSLVNSFGVNGISRFSFGDDDYGNAIYADTDSLYLAGGIRHTDDRFYQGFISKIDHFGIVIPGFGTSGIIEIGSGKSFSKNINIIPSTNGSFYITGVENNLKEDKFVTKIDSNGNLISSYGKNGTAYFDNGIEIPKSAVKLNNERILLTSESDRQTITFKNPNPLFADITLNAPVKYSFCVIDSNGNPEIGTKKDFPIKTNQFTQVKSVRKDNNGKIILLATSYSPPKYDYFIIRHNADFSLDNSFGNNGKSERFSSSNNESYIVDIQIAPDNGIVLLTWSSSSSSKFTLSKIGDLAFGQNAQYTNADLAGNGPTGISHFWKFNNGYYIHYLIDGKAKIAHIGFNGIISTFGTAELDISVSSMQQLSDSSFIIVGYKGSEIIMYRYFTNGKRDINFNKNGVLNSIPFTESNNINDFILNPDNSVVFCHQIYDGTNPYYIGVSKYSLKNNQSTSISTISTNSNVKLYPNPFSQGVNLELSGLASNASAFDFTLSDMSGRALPISVDLLSDNKLYIESSTNLPPGIYILFGRSSTNESIQVKLIKY